MVRSRTIFFSASAGELSEQQGAILVLPPGAGSLPTRVQAFGNFSPASSLDVTYNHGRPLEKK